MDLPANIQSERAESDSESVLLVNDSGPPVTGDELVPFAGPECLRPLGSPRPNHQSVFVPKLHLPPFSKNR